MYVFINKWPCTFDNARRHASVEIRRFGQLDDSRQDGEGNGRRHGFSRQWQEPCCCPHGTLR